MSITAKIVSWYITHIKFSIDKTQTMKNIYGFDSGNFSEVNF